MDGYVVIRWKKYVVISVDGKKTDSFFNIEI